MSTGGGDVCDRFHLYIAGTCGLVTVRLCCRASDAAGNLSGYSNTVNATTAAATGSIRDCLSSARASSLQDLIGGITDASSFSFRSPSRRNENRVDLWQPFRAHCRGPALVLAGAAPHPGERPNSRLSTQILR
jgi:hypothetical protein